MEAACAFFPQGRVLWPADMSTFVSVGNAKQPFGRLLDAVAAIAAELPQPVVVQPGHNEFACAGCEVHDFMGMAEFEEKMNAAELVIIHAGAGSIIHALRKGKVPVVVPRRAEYAEHVDDHQLELAQHFAEIGRVVVVKDIARLAEGARQAQAMQHELKSVSNANAAIDLVKAAIDRSCGD